MTAMPSSLFARLVAGMVLVSIGLLLASRSGSLREVFVVYGLGLGVGMGFAYVPSVAAVQRWFVRRRRLLPTVRSADGPATLD